MQPNYLAEALYEKAQAEYLNKNYPETITLLHSALGQLESTEPVLKGLIYLLLAKSYYATAQYREARKICTQSQKYFLTHHLVSEAAELQQLAGQIYCEQGRYQEAIAVYEKALQFLSSRLLTPAQMELKAEIHLALGAAAEQIRATDLQRKHFLRGVFIARHLGNDAIYARALLGLGVCFLQKQKLPKARTILLKAIQHFNRLEMPAGFALTLHTLGQVYMKTFEYRRAVNAFTFAYVLFQKLDDKLHQASSLAFLGRIFAKIDLDITEQICANITDLLITDTSIHSKRQAEIIYGRYSIVMGLIYEQNNYPDLARSSIKEGIDIFQLYNCEEEHAEALEILRNIKTCEAIQRPKKNNILLFKLGIIS